MFCKSCGKEIRDKAVICVHCGVETGNSPYYPDELESQRVSGLANMPASGGMIALAILIPLVGLIMGVSKKSAGQTRAGNTMIKAAIITWIVSAVILGVYYGIVLAAFM